MNYRAPTKDILFALKHLAEYESQTNLPGYAEADFDTAKAIVEECAKLSESVFAPLNTIGDKNPSTWHDGEVATTPGFKEAYQQYVDGGWQGLEHPAEFGGQGLPKALTTARTEILCSANLGFSLCPLLTDSAIDAILMAASDDLKKRYVAKMVSGEWSGTMNLTEPQAGSDLELIRARAEPQTDGTYRVFGTKIFITYGEQDYTENIVHLVLARVPGAPAGVKGISLFVVPKFLVNEDGSLGERNDVHCVSIEHKLGIKASPTAILQYGDHGGAVGHLLGEENRGLEYMFVMMNAARFAVGVQGIAIAERAYQQALGYARERLQSRPVDGSAAKAVPIVRHPDVKRMLMTMRALVEGCRGLAFSSAALFDAMNGHPDKEARQRARRQYEFLVPLLKGFATEMSIEVTSLGIQVHGGMGFIEETGAAQHLRDARILAIYEGTTAIQANDLVGRKTLRDGGEAAREIASLIARTEAALREHKQVNATKFADRLASARLAFLDVVSFVCEYAKSAPNVVFAGSVPYLFLGGILVAGWQLGRGLLAALECKAKGEDPDYMESKLLIAEFYAEHILTQSSGLRERVTLGGTVVDRMDDALL